MDRCLNCNVSIVWVENAKRWLHQSTGELYAGCRFVATVVGP